MTGDGHGPARGPTGCRPAGRARMAACEPCVQALSAGAVRAGRTMTMPDGPVTRRYLDQCLLDGALRDARSRAVTGPAFTQAYASMPLPLPRPLFVDETLIRGAADDVYAIFDLMVSLPARLSTRIEGWLPVWGV